MRSAGALAAVLFSIFVLQFSISAPAQQTSTQPAPPATDTSHGIDQVDAAPLGGVIAVPLQEKQRKQMKKYDLPELVGARQALGSQLVDGELPRPLIDYEVTDSNVEQRLSIFEHGLTVIAMNGTGGSMLKKVILPADALDTYQKAVSPTRLSAVEHGRISPPQKGRRALLRVYLRDRSYVEVAFDPAGAIPKNLGDQVRPLEDLLRALSEDRTVTNSVAGYEPKVGDELVGDDRKTWRVERVIQDAGIVELHCVGQPTVIYVAKKDLYNYFIGKPETK
ncbi:MAG TPA: hypothetical protein VEZ11_06130 [Thermoanaerobaculia bacterium]|nr:hypothetical protein [Thermoanaerobaculia bacterium]